MLVETELIYSTERKEKVPIKFDNVFIYSFNLHSAVTKRLLNSVINSMIVQIRMMMRNILLQTNRKERNSMNSISSSF